MLPSYAILRSQLSGVIAAKTRQGHVTAGLAEVLAGLPDSYDALWAFAQHLRALPMRSDWTYVEPNELAEIFAAADPARPTGPIAVVDPVAIAPRIENAFLTSLCGCMLGKPIEISWYGHQLREKLEPAGLWPITGYLSERALEVIGHRHGDWSYTVRERMVDAGPDDDINYSVIGMLLLERHGADFTRDHLRDIWLKNIPLLWQWGPERMVNLKAAMHSLVWSKEPTPFADWVEVCNPNDEACGAQIRADAYGYACPGDPARAAALAWKDAGYTHRRTGIYATMWTAAAIATACVRDDWRSIAATANQFVPMHSRFHQTVREAIDLVAAASDWWNGYTRIEERFRGLGHCQIHMEVATVINTLRWATSPAEGICMQVMQGNDTDSYGCTCGSILGAKFGPNSLDPAWTAPFNDRIRTTVAGLHEPRLSVLTARMGKLPARLAQEASPT